MTRKKKTHRMTEAEFTQLKGITNLGLSFSKAKKAGLTTRSYATWIAVSQSNTWEEYRAEIAKSVAKLKEYMEGKKTREAQNPSDLRKEIEDLKTLITVGFQSIRNELHRSATTASENNGRTKESPRLWNQHLYKQER